MIIPIQSIEQFHQFLPINQSHPRRQSRISTRNFHLAHHLCTRPRPESRNQRERLQIEQTNLPDPIGIIIVIVVNLYGVRLAGLVGLGAKVRRCRASVGEIAGESRLEEGAEDDLGTAVRKLLVLVYIRGTE